MNQLSKLYDTSLHLSEQVSRHMLLTASVVHLNCTGPRGPGEGADAPETTPNTSFDDLRK